MLQCIEVWPEFASFFSFGCLTAFHRLDLENVFAFHQPNHLQRLFQDILQHFSFLKSLGLNLGQTFVFFDTFTQLRVEFLQ